MTHKVTNLASAMVAGAGLAEMPEQDGRHTVKAKSLCHAQSKRIAKIVLCLLIMGSLFLPLPPVPALIVSLIVCVFSVYQLIILKRGGQLQQLFQPITAMLAGKR